MKARFIIQRKQTKYAEGIFDIVSDSNELLFTSPMYSGSKFAGVNNKGAMPEGDYNIVYIRFDKNPSFTRDSYGWIAGLIPLFQTERFDLAIHPDGQIVSIAITHGLPDGSAGCGVNTWSLDDSVKLHNLIQQGLEKGSIPFTCLYVPDQPHA